MANYDVMLSTFNCNLEDIVSLPYWNDQEFKIRKEHCMLEYLSFNPNNGAKDISMILNEV